MPINPELYPLMKLSTIFFFRKNLALLLCIGMIPIGILQAQGPSEEGGEKKQKKEKKSFDRSPSCYRGRSNLRFDFGGSPLHQLDHGQS